MNKLNIDNKGYAKELLLYPISLFLKKRKPSEKFIIFGLPRTGSTLLVDLLNNHPQIHCDGELWAHQLYKPFLYLECRSLLNKKDYFGFKLLVTHFEIQRIDKSKNIIEDFHQEGYRIISLTRRNLYRAALSTIYAGFLGKFHVSKSEEKKIRPQMQVDPQILIQKLHRFDYLSEWHKRSINSVPHLDLIYEDDLLSENRHQNTINQVFQFLGIRSVKVSSDQLRVTSDDVSGFVSNFDEIEDFISKTEYARYL